MHRVIHWSLQLGYRQLIKKKSMWPGLSLKVIKRHLLFSPTTVHSHKKRKRQGLQSTTKPVVLP